MVWVLVERPKTIKVTKRNATELAEMDSPAMDRPLRERRLNVYRRELNSGNFRPVSWAKAYCRETKTWYRINGQHTSTLFSSVDKLSEFQELFAVVEEYDCDTLEDVSRLWSTFDSQAQTRNATEINRAFVASIGEIAEYAGNTRFTNLVVGGLCFYQSPATVGVIGGLADRAELLFDHVEEYKWLLTVLTGKGNSNAKILQRVPVVACMVGSFNKSRKAANEFWNAVKDATGTEPGLPDRVLNRWLLENAVVSGRNYKAKKNPREFYVASPRNRCQTVRQHRQNPGTPLVLRGDISGSETCGHSGDRMICACAINSPGLTSPQTAPSPPISTLNLPPRFLRKPTRGSCGNCSSDAE